MAKQAVDMLQYETQAKQNGLRFIFGVDEAGRGPLAGPVVAAAVCLRETNFNCRIDDSKKLTPLARLKAFDEIFNNAYVGIGIMSPGVIDQVNILNATFLAMDQALEDLMRRLPKDETLGIDIKSKAQVLVDGNQMRSRLGLNVRTIIGGDACSLSIACASIIAKVYRDRLMDKYDQVFPVYGFKQHKGYPTASHRQAISRHGLSIIHRKSFNAV